MERKTLKRPQKSESSSWKYHPVAYYTARCTCPVPYPSSERGQYPPRCGECGGYYTPRGGTSDGEK